MSSAEILKDAVFRAKRSTLLHSDYAALRRMEQTERLDPAELDALTRTRSAAIARFASAHSPFYAEKYARAGVKPGDITDDAAFQELPLLEKAELRDFADRIRSDEATDRNTQVAITGGSTGMPLKILHDQRNRRRAIAWRQFAWWGISPADNVAHVWRNTRTGRAELIHQLKWWPSRSIQLDADEITEASVRRFVAQWERISPRLMLGYTGAAFALATMMDGMGLRFGTPPLAVGVTASGVTAAQSEFMSEVFGAPIYDHYRAVEMPFIAGQCAAHGGLHVMSDVRRIEILGDDGRPVPPGVEGQIVLTDLLNRAFPIVRYRIGDMGSYREETCPCGRTLPLLNPIAGRLDDTVRLPDGTIFGPSFSVPLAKETVAIRQFQIVQHADYAVTLRCVPNQVPDAQARLEAVRATVAERLHHAVPVQLDLVDSIPHNRGKTRVIFSELSSDTPHPGAVEQVM